MVRQTNRLLEYTDIILQLQIGVHYGGSFYEFVPWTGTISWDIAQWGFWHMSAENDTHVVTYLYPVLKN